MLSIEAALGMVSIFAELRPDELGRIARLAERRVLENGETFALPPTTDAARLAIVVSGELDAVFEDPTGAVHQRMLPGDRYGETMLLTSELRSVRFRARRSSELALFERAVFLDLLRDFPVVALPLAAELSSELRARNQQVRQILELYSSGLPRAEVENATNRLRRSLVKRSVGLRRASPRGLFRRLVIERGNEPTFWMLIGFLGGLGGARVVVYLIIKYHLEKQLYALVAGSDPNPMHIHHFNYGLLIVGVVGIAALTPGARRALRTLALFFGIGCGLTFDEFALFWNLRPDYYQGLSLITAAIAAVILVQLAYFRHFWLALMRRVLAGDAE